MFLVIDSWILEYRSTGVEVIDSWILEYRSTGVLVIDSWILETRVQEFEAYATTSIKLEPLYKYLSIFILTIDKSYY